MEENNIFQKEDKKEELDLVRTFVFIGIVALIFFFIFFKGSKENHDVNNDIVVSVGNPFDNISLEAQSVFVWDVVNQEEIYSLNPEAQIHLASLTKVVMALTAYEIAPKGTIIIIDAESLKEEGDSGLMENEHWKLKDLIDFSLMVSSNDGASAIAGVLGATRSYSMPNQTSREVFTDLMNRKVREIGLNQTYFTSPTGLDRDDVIPGGQGSARDMALLFNYILKNNPEILEATGYKSLIFNSLDNLEHEGENTNILVGKLPGIFASKTGFTDLAGGNLVIAFDAGIMHPIIISVMGSTLEGRFSDVEELYRTTLMSLGI